MAQDHDIESTSSSTLDEIAASYDQLEIQTDRYLMFIVAPASVFFLVTVLAPLFVSVPFVVGLAMPALGLLVFVAAVAYPKLEMDQRRIAMENQYHLVVTHMTVLSVTNIDRMEVFRTIAAEEEYGALAEEFNRIVELVDTWNQSLDDACRRRAKAVPSETVADFLERLAYTLGAGQSLEDFLLNEQSIMLEDYTTVYESTLDNLNVLKDLYVSMLMSMTFGLVFAILLPMLTGTNPTLTVAVVLVIFVFVQLGFYTAIRSMVPYDPIWFQPEAFTTDAERRVRYAMAGGVGLTAVLILLVGGVITGVGVARALLPPDRIPQPLMLAIPVTPLAIPGIVFHLEEAKIKRRDGEFPSFLRALGAAETAKQSTTTDVLSTLRRKDFGPLTTDINALYRRLNMRIDTVLAWRHFAGEANSYLIQKFSEMYLIAREMGGTPKLLGELISRNMSAVNHLREQRRHATVTLIGVLYGITAASVFAFFIALEIVGLLAGMDLDLADVQGLHFGQIVYTEAYNIPMIEAFLYIVILFNAMLSSLLIRTTDGGHKGNAYLHFVVLTWISALTAVVTVRLIENFLVI